MFAHASAPCRIGIAGGGTDLPVWVNSGRVGRCLSLAIDVRAHAVAITRPDRRVVASYRRLDEATCATEIANGLIRESALMHGWEDGFEVHTMSEVSSRGSGLGASSALAVALAAVFSRMTCLAKAQVVDPKWMDGGEPAFRQTAAEHAWKVEIERLRRPVGRQDHVAAAHGGLRLYRFEGTTATIEREFSRDDARWLAERLVLVELPSGHDAREVLSGAMDIIALERAAEAVEVAIRAVETRDILALGEALRLGHESKKSTPGAITETVQTALLDALTADGVSGGKVTGAGGGGHLVIACEPGSAERVMTRARLPVRGVRPDFNGVTSEVQP